MGEDTRDLRRRPDSRQLATGVYRRPRGPLFRAIVCSKGRQIYLGDYRSPEEAAAAVKRAKREARR
jgi:hypothetical protein